MSQGKKEIEIEGEATGRDRIATTYLKIAGNVFLKMSEGERDRLIEKYGCPQFQRLSTVPSDMGNTFFSEIEKLVLGKDGKIVGRDEYIIVGLHITDDIEPLDYSNLLSSSLKQYYDKTAGFIPRIFPDLPSLPIKKKCFINLAIVKKEKQKETEVSQLQSSPTERSTLYLNYENIYCTDYEKTTSPQTLFDERNNEPQRRLIIFGRAGIGKSALSQYLAYNWAQNNLWSQFEWVLKIKLRDLNTKKYTSLAEICKAQCLDSSDLTNVEDISRTLTLNAEKVLIILDGYDEFNSQSGCSKIVNDLLNDTRPYYLIVTSRPFVSLPLERFDLVLECIGFVTEDIIHFIQLPQVCDSQSKQQQILDFLEQQPAVHTLVHVPILLDILCAIWEKDLFEENTSITMTTLYDKLVGAFWKAYDKKQEAVNVKTTSSEILEKKKKAKRFLGRLATKAMKSYQIMLEAEDVHRIVKASYGCDTDDVPLYLKDLIAPGLLYSPDSGQESAHYYFPHLTIQEFLAAQDWANSFQSKEEEVQRKVERRLRKNKYHPRYSILWGLAAGLLKNELKAFGRYINLLQEKDSRDLIGNVAYGLWVMILEEGESPKTHSILKPIRQQLANEIFNLYQQNTRGFRENFTELPLVTAITHKIDQGKIDDDLVEKLPFNAVDNRTLRMMFSFLARTSLTTPRTVSYLVKNVVHNKSTTVGSMRKRAATAEVLSAFVAYLTDEDPKVCLLATDALGKMGKKAATPEVLKALVTNLTHKDYEVRSSTADALGWMGEKAATPEVLEALVTNLIHEDDGVRISVAAALGWMSEKAATPEVLESLVPNLTHKDYEVCLSAAEALGGMGEKAATPEVLAALMTNLTHEDPKVCSLAAEVLGRMGEKAATPEVLAALLTNLTNEDAEVRISVVMALRKMDEKAATTEVLAALVTSLTHQDVVVRISAAMALWKMGEKAATTEVLSALVTSLTLTDEDFRVHSFAAMTLGRVSEKAVSAEVLEGLVTNLTHEDPKVRSLAAEALGSMGERAATAEVLEGLVTNLAHEYPKVRRSAAKALGKMGERAATAEVLEGLVTNFTHENPKVRGSAAKALERMGEKAATAKVLEGLVTNLTHEYPKVRRSAAKVLGKMGERAATAEMLEGLATNLTHEDPKVRSSAVKVSGKMGERAATAKVLEGLVTNLTHEDPKVCRSAAKALERMGEKAATAKVLEGLVTNLTHENPKVCRSAAKALERMGEKAATAKVLEGLVTNLTHEDAEVCRSAAKALERMGKRAATAEVLAALVTNLIHEDAEVRSSVADALERMSEKVATSQVLRVFFTHYYIKGIEHIECRIMVLGQLVRRNFDKLAKLWLNSSGDMQSKPYLFELALSAHLAGNVVFQILMGKEDKSAVWQVFNGKETFYYAISLEQAELLSDWVPDIVAAWKSKGIWGLQELRLSKLLPANVIPPNLFGISDEELPVKRLMWQAEEAMQQNELLKATSYYEQYIKIAPEEASQVYYNLAWCYFASGNKKESENTFIMAIKHNPRANIYADFGHFLYQQQRYQEALSYLKQAVELPHEGKTLLYDQVSQFVIEPGLQQLVQEHGQFSIEPTFLAHYLLYYCYQQLQQVDQAEQQFLYIQKYIRKIEDNTSILRLSSSIEIERALFNLISHHKARIHPHSVNAEAFYLSTLGDGNCFFHATFGIPDSQGYYLAELAQKMRLSWETFLAQFRSLAGVASLKPLQEELRHVFMLILEDLENFEQDFEPSEYELLTQEINQVKTLQETAKNNVNGMVKKMIQALTSQAETAQPLLIKLVKDILERTNEIEEKSYSDQFKDNPSNLQEHLNKLEGLKSKLRIYAEQSKLATGSLSTQHLQEIGALLLQYQAYIEDRIRDEQLHDYIRLFMPSVADDYDQTFRSDRIVEKFLESEFLYSSYLWAIRNQSYYIHVEEIKVLASISDKTITLFYKEEQGDLVSCDYTPDPTIRAAYWDFLQKKHRQEDRTLWGEEKAVEIYHAGFDAMGTQIGMHFSRTASDHFPKLKLATKQKGEDTTKQSVVNVNSRRKGKIKETGKESANLSQLGIFASNQRGISSVALSQESGELSQASHETISHSS